MSVKYSLSEKGNPQNAAAPKKWYAGTKNAGNIRLRALSKEIARRSAVNTADTAAVLEALTQVLTDNLAEGRIVRFGDFGSFQVTIGSEGAETADKFNTKMIKSKKVTFRPGIDLKEMLNKMKFEEA
ncbi:MAG: HU family DNA-binding protein [Prevotellaceae bacterium]|jgi:predicted histone-like DNA-binding protein|nr:HU family DNA-binding protein [Prevotellaceae bacterium]